MVKELIMSKYDYVKNLKDEDFRLLTGVKKDTFNLMLKYLYENQRSKKKSGKPCKLCVEDKLLITLDFLRENRSFFHLATDHQVHKTTIMRSIYWVEDILSKCEEFKLPSKKKLLDNSMEYEVFIVDATETPIERPIIKSKSKKNTKEERKEKD
jgi:hypothetical protein